MPSGACEASSEPKEIHGLPISFFVPAHDKPGRFVPAVQDDATVAAVVQGLTRLWHHKEAAVIRDLYFHGAALVAYWHA